MPMKQMKIKEIWDKVWHVDMLYEKRHSWTVTRVSTIILPLYLKCVYPYCCISPYWKHNELFGKITSEMRYIFGRMLMCHFVEWCRMFACGSTKYHYIVLIFISGINESNISKLWISLATCIFIYNDKTKQNNCINDKAGNQYDKYINPWTNKTAYGPGVSGYIVHEYDLHWSRWYKS